MGQKILKLVEAADTGDMMKTAELDHVEEGDRIGGFKVATVEETECSHPQRYWTPDEKHSAGPPEIVGTCQVCGDIVYYTPDEAKRSEQTTDE